MEQVFLDPGFIDNASWAELSSLLRSLGQAIVFVVLIASNMLVGHNMIPSFIESHHIGRQWNKARPILYASAIICFTLAMVFIGRAAHFAGVLRNFWPDYWI